MSLDLLDAPLRVTWDFPVDAGLSAADLDCLTGRLSAAGVFAVTCTGRPLLRPTLPALLARLRADGCRITVVHGGGDAESAALGQGFGCDRLLIDAAPFVDDRVTVDAAGLSALISGVRRQGFEPALQLIPSHRNLRLLPELLQRCGEWGVAQLTLPNTPVDDSFKPSVCAHLPRPGDLDSLRRALAETPPAGVQLEIHDLFLWELFSAWNEGAGRGEYGGCQAGNSVGHIDGQGRLHPCSSWHEPLGSLLDAALEDLWQTPARFAVRAAIAAVPPGCAGCSDYLNCFGGCRGLTRAAAESDAGRDLLCSGPRGAAT